MSLTFKRILRRMRAPGFAVGMALVALIVFVALFSRFITPFPAIEQHPRDSLLPPGGAYLLGTDEFGRDILSRLMAGATNSMRVSVVAIALSAVFGSVIGMVAGYFGGLLDALIMRATDILFAFPAILLALFIVSALGPSVINAIIAIAIVYMPIFARVARGPTLLVKTREYVQASEALGATDARRLARHVLPNIAAPIIVQITLALAQATLTEAALSYLGLGILPPEPSWGGMLSDARKLMEIAPWMAIAPGAAIMLAVLGFNLFGDGLRDWLDPQLRNQA
ncbi:MAG TPA: ABC transporter permease [Thermoflexales bacterium]|nr:ABC transporter permease [Thermoflexales bacterium]HQW35482.1 ABC transporter permease [Thermoflexales bacterium]HQZ21456.1 ABC transporter permease [Thermoflexales bacterium]HRA00878.1 ABC transporter permease [Thermoflexales bacterium]